MDVLVYYVPTMNSLVRKKLGKVPGILLYYCMYVTPDEASQAPGPAWMKENSVFADYD